MSDVKVSVGGITILVDPSSQTLHALNADGPADEINVNTEAPVVSESSAAKELTEVVKEKKEDVKPVVETVERKGEEAAGTVQEVLEATKEKIEVVVETVKEKIGEVLRDAEKKTFYTTDVAEEKPSNATDVVKEKISEAVDTVEEKTSDSANVVEKRTSDTADPAKETVEKEKHRMDAAPSEAKEEFKDAVSSPQDEGSSVRRSSVFNEVEIEPKVKQEGTAVVEITEIPTAQEAEAGAKPKRTLTTIQVDDASTLNEGAQSTTDRKSTNAAPDYAGAVTTTTTTNSGRAIDKFRAKLPIGLLKILVGSALASEVQAKLRERVGTVSVPLPVPAPPSPGIEP